MKTWEVRKAETLWFSFLTSPAQESNILWVPHFLSELGCVVESSMWWSRSWQGLLSGTVLGLMPALNRRYFKCIIHNCSLQKIFLHSHVLDINYYCTHTTVKDMWSEYIGAELFLYKGELCNLQSLLEEIKIIFKGAVLKQWGHSFIFILFLTYFQWENLTILEFWSKLGELYILNFLFMLKIYP